MNVKTWIPLLLAIALGLIAMVVARKALKPSGGNTEPTNVTAVVVAKRDVQPGHELGAEDLAVVRYPSGQVPTRAFHTPAELTGRTPTMTLVKGQTILDTLLAPTGSGAGMQALVPDGMRAITIEVNEFTGLAGMLLPGARVDIVAVVRDDKTAQPMARTILQNIKVLAVGHQLSAQPAQEGPPPAPSNNVTLLVNPKEAQTLQLASQGGRPWLVLRSQIDASQTDGNGTSMADLKGESPLPATPVIDPFAVPATQPTTKPAAPRTGRMVQVINGGVISEIEVPFAEVLPTVDTPPAVTPAAPAAEPKLEPMPSKTAPDPVVTSLDQEQLQDETPDDLNK